MSDASSTLDQRKILAEIDQLYANTHKLLMEATKFHVDARFAGWQVAFAGFTAGALVIGVILTAMKLLGV